MKEIVRFEQDASIKIYQRYNKFEKDLLGELKLREKEKKDLDLSQKR
jgi:hypothetical protein